MRCDVRRKWLLWAPLLTLGFIGFIAIGGAVVQQLWNWLLPTLFDVRRITFWQALGILALSRILFGGFGGRGGYAGGHKRRHRMTPEERQRFGDGMGGAPAADRAGTAEPGPWA